MFGEKIRVAMYAGAHAVVVVDNLDHPNVFLMTDGLADSHPPVTIPSVLINKTMGERLKEALFESEEYMISLRVPYDDEEFPEEEMFYASQPGDNAMMLNLDLENFDQGNLAEMVIKQLQQMNIQIDGQFQIQFMNENNQLDTLVINGNSPNNNLSPEAEQMECAGEECTTEQPDTDDKGESEKKGGSESKGRSEGEDEEEEQKAKERKGRSEGEGEEEEQKAKEKKGRSEGEGEEEEQKAKERKGRSEGEGEEEEQKAKERKFLRAPTNPDLQGKRKKP